jgi:hypothetical protein
VKARAAEISARKTLHRKKAANYAVFFYLRRPLISETLLTVGAAIISRRAAFDNRFSRPA